MIADALARDFVDHLEVIPSATGLHIAALARTASADRIGAVVRRASDTGVAVQELSKFGINSPGPPGVLLAYGAIPPHASKTGCGGYDLASTTIVDSPAAKSTT